jgi:hypothetical protein
MTPSFTKFALTTHITTSVGWLGAVAGFLVLSIAGVASHDSEVVRGVYISMNLIGLYVIVPLSLAALLTGLVQSLGTHWGLFRHYWVLTKFLLTIGATWLLLLHQFATVARAARRVSAAAPGVFPEVGELAVQLLGDAGLALLALLAITTLSVYKPWGRTRYGIRKQRELLPTTAELPLPSAVLALPDSVNEERAPSLPLGLKVFIIATGLVVLMFGVMHHSGQGFHHVH